MGDQENEGSGRNQQPHDRADSCFVPGQWYTDVQDNELLCMHVVLGLGDKPTMMVHHIVHL